MLSANERAVYTIFKVFGMNRPGIEPTISRTQTGRSSNLATAPVGSNVIDLEPAHVKTNKMTGLQGKIRSTWVSAQSDQSSLCTQWVAKELRFLRVDSEN